MEAIDAAIEATRAELQSLRTQRYHERKMQLLEQGHMREGYYRRMEALKRKQRYQPLHSFSEALNNVYGKDMHSPLILSQQAKLCRAIHQNEVLKHQAKLIKDSVTEEVKISQRLVGLIVDKRTTTETKLISQIIILSSEIAELKSHNRDLQAGKLPPFVHDDLPKSKFQTLKAFALVTCVGDMTEDLFPERVVCAAHAG